MKKLLSMTFFSLMLLLQTTYAAESETENNHEVSAEGIEDIQENEESTMPEKKEAEPRSPIRENTEKVPEEAVEEPSESESGAAEREELRELQEAEIREGNQDALSPDELEAEAAEQKELREVQEAESK